MLDLAFGLGFDHDGTLNVGQGVLDQITFQELALKQLKVQFGRGLKLASGNMTGLCQHKLIPTVISRASKCPYAVWSSRDRGDIVTWTHGLTR
jgi:hypothetical protein